MNPHDRLRGDLFRDLNHKAPPASTPGLLDRAGDFLQRHVGSAILLVCLLVISGIIALALVNFMLGCETGSEEGCVVPSQTLREIWNGWQHMSNIFPD